MDHDDPNPRQAAVDPTAEGSRARTQGKSRDDCPYPAGSEESHEWLEGYDGQGTQGAPLTPETKN